MSKEEVAPRRAIRPPPPPLPTPPPESEATISARTAAKALKELAAWRRELSKRVLMADASHDTLRLHIDYIVGWRESACLALYEFAALLLREDRVERAENVKSAARHIADHKHKVEEDEELALLFERWVDESKDRATVPSPPPAMEEGVDAEPPSDYVNDTLEPGADDGVDAPQ